MIGFQADAGKYFSFLAIILIHASVSAIMGIMISSGAPNVRVGQIIVG